MHLPSDDSNAAIHPLETALRLLTATLLLCLVITIVSCGGGSSTAAPPASAISGNWEMTLRRHNSTEPWIFSGFLLQSGGLVSGSVILGAGVGCQGVVGPVTGTFDGQKLQLTIGSFGQDFSLTGGMTSGGSGSDSLQGQFSTVEGGCLGFSSTGTWSAVRIPTLSTSFHGQFVPAAVNVATIDVSGSLTQGSNVGASNATLTGTIKSTGGSQFCPYISTGSVTGVISGTNVVLNLYGPDGSKIGQIPDFGFPAATLSADATSLTGDYSLQGLSVDCPLNSGTVTLTFP